MLSDDDLALMRREAGELMPATCTILTGGVTSDGGGGQVESYLAGSPLACRLAPVAGGEKAGTPKVDDRTTHMLTLPYETQIAEKDRVRVGTAVFEVTAVRTRAEWEVARRVELMEAPA